jgi:hypothetical protein
MIFEFPWHGLWMCFEGFQHFHGHGLSQYYKRGPNVYYPTLEIFHIRTFSNLFFHIITFESFTCEKNLNYFLKQDQQVKFLELKRSQ